MWTGHRLQNQNGRTLVNGRVPRSPFIITTVPSTFMSFMKLNLSPAENTACLRRVAPFFARSRCISIRFISIVNTELGSRTIGARPR
jgi:hypothetical protein